jgi:hypothetical protein
LQVLYQTIYFGFKEKALWSALFLQASGLHLKGNNFSSFPPSCMGHIENLVGFNIKPRQTLASEMNSDALPFLGGERHFEIFIV